jgi:ankyrin repeat protein
MTPLHWVASHGFVEEAKLLVSRGAAIGGEILSNALPMAFALKNKHYAMVDCLIKAGADTNYALLKVVQNNEIKIGEKLVRAGANLRFQTSGDCNLLHFRSDGGSYQSIRWLLNQGLDLSAKDCIGETPLH